MANHTRGHERRIKVRQTWETRRKLYGQTGRKNPAVYSIKTDCQHCLKKTFGFVRLFVDGRITIEELLSMTGVPGAVLDVWIESIKIERRRAAVMTGKAAE